MKDRADRKLRPAPDVHVRTFDGELVLLDLARGDYFGTNEVGAAFWEGLVAGRSPREIAAELASRYDVTPEQLLTDLLALADQLEARGLAVPHDDDRPGEG